MLVMTAIAETSATAAPRFAALGPDTLAELAARALREEAILTPKPGLVDLRSGNSRPDNSRPDNGRPDNGRPDNGRPDNGRPGNSRPDNSHPDMDVGILLASADALADPIARCAEAARATPLGPQLRARIGAIGRAGEQRMLHATGGVNTHRGALWVLGLLAAGLAVHPDPASAATFAARLASIPDPALPVREPSHGALARRRYGATGAVGEACAGFPHTMRVALPALRSARSAGYDEDTARLAALVTCMASLEDTCTLHRGGREGLAIVRDGANLIMRAGGCATARGRQLLDELDLVTRRLRLSTGGSGDVLAAALFVDSAFVGTHGKE